MTSFLFKITHPSYCIRICRIINICFCAYIKKTRKNQENTYFNAEADMEHKDLKPMTPFDTLTQDESMRMMKLLIPFLSPSVQKMLSVYIKYTEFKNTIEYFSGFDKAPLKSQSSDPRDFSFTEILEEIRPYMADNEGNMIDSVLSALQMIELMGSMNLSPFDFGSYNNTEDNETHIEKEEGNYDDELDGKSPIPGSGSSETGTD